MDHNTEEALAGLAKELGLMEQAAQQWLDHAAKCGQNLLAAQEQLSTDEWPGWLEANMPFSPDIAELYMRVARDEDTLRSDPEAIAEAMLTMAWLPTGGRR